MKRCALLLAFVSVSLLPAGASASPRVTQRDRATTREYLHATYAYERRAYAELAAIVAAIETRANEIARECPSALTYSPRDTAFEALGEEAELSALYAGMAPVRGSMLHLAQAIRRLRWSDRRLTRLVRAQAAAEHATATLALPDLCADIAAWKASAYATLPHGSASFLARVRAIESALSGTTPEESTEAEIRRLLRPYESPSQRRIAKRVERLERRIDRRLAAAVTVARKKLAAALGVSAL